MVYSLIFIYLLLAASAQNQKTEPVKHNWIPVPRPQSPDLRTLDLRPRTSVPQTSVPVTLPVSRCLLAAVLLNSSVVLGWFWSSLAV